LDRFISDKLTAREIEVVEALKYANTEKELAKYLFISPATVKTHLNHIYRKLNTCSKHGTLIKAVELGYIEIARI